MNERWVWNLIGILAIIGAATVGFGSIWLVWWLISHVRFA